MKPYAASHKGIGWQASNALARESAQGFLETREDAWRFVKEVRGDDPKLASCLQIEERELEAGWLNWPASESRRHRFAARASPPPSETMKAPHSRGFLTSAPGKIRTCGLCLRRAALYPLSYGRSGSEV